MENYSAPPAAQPRPRAPLLAAGGLLGAGLGGFVDGILLHQLLQWHNMLSGRLPPNTLVAAKVNMYWDGLFDAAMWLLTVLGLSLLWVAGGRAEVPWSGRTFGGALLMGWGAFNVVEGLIDHEILGLHHVYEYTTQHLPGDLAFLGLGVLLLLAGNGLVRAGRADARPAGRPR